MFRSYAQVGDIVPFTPWVNAGHAEELMFVFGMPFIDELADIHGHNMTDDEKSLSVKIMTMWSNFAKYGYANKTTHDRDIVHRLLLQLPLEKMLHKKYEPQI